jgi:hypothetical protein
MPNLISNRPASRGRVGILIALLCLGATAIAHAEGRDVVEFGNDIVVHAGEEAHDTVCFLCSIEVDGTVHGDMVALLGNIHVRGHAERDAVVFLGSITLGENASIDRDVVVFAGSLHNAPGSSIGNDRVVFPVFLLFLPLLIFAGIIVLIVWAIRALVYRNQPVYPMPPPRF